jgi:glycosyltransferase involved in cell wall biosynthesis
MGTVRIAWFSPFPPVKTGIAGRSAELLDALRGRGYTIDAYPEARAHDFPWRGGLEPYDLVVYQFGNSSHHDYEWPYALRYPGLLVLHDTQVHHARAALLLREKRIDDYRAEFRWSAPDVSPDGAEIAIAGFDSALYYNWAFTRALVDTSLLVAVHGDGARRGLIEALARPRSEVAGRSSETGGRTSDAPDIELEDKIVAIRLGEGVIVSPEREARARRDVRAKYGIPQDAVLFGCFGGLTAEKRIPQIVAAFRTIEPPAPDARLLLAGAAAAHFDVDAEISGGPGRSSSITLAGYLETDDDLTDYIAACDVTLNLRWPTARETSGPWLRALAAGKPTVITDLVHLADVISLDPRTWRARDNGPRTTDHGSRPADPVCIAIDIVDEDHSLRLAIRRLAADADLRARLGCAAREYWRREHSVDGMADDYERIMREAAARPAPVVEVPAHMRDPGDRRLKELLAPFGVAPPI